MIVFVFVANKQSCKSSKFLDNVTLLSGQKVSFMRAKTTSNTLQCLQNELVRLIDRTCNFRMEAYTEPCKTSKMELFVNS